MPAGLLCQGIGMAESVIDQILCGTSGTSVQWDQKTESAYLQLQRSKAEFELFRTP
jgi:hypothetical protein